MARQSRNQILLVVVLVLGLGLVSRFEDEDEGEEDFGGNRRLRLTDST